MIPCRVSGGLELSVPQYKRKMHILPSIRTYRVLWKPSRYVRDHSFPVALLGFFTHDFVITSLYLDIKACTNAKVSLWLVIGSIQIFEEVEEQLRERLSCDRPQQHYSNNNPWHGKENEDV